MTIRFLTPWGPYPIASTVTFDAATETSLVAAKVASTDLTGGTPYSVPAPVYDRLTAEETRQTKGVVSPDGNTAKAAAARNVQINGSAGDLGTLAASWNGTRSDTGTNATRTQYTRALASTQSSLSPDKAAPNVIRIVGNDGASQVSWTEQITAIDATTVRNIGIWCRASVRPDGRKYTMARVMLAQDNAGSPNFGAAYADWNFAVPADAVWRFVVLSTSATTGINTGGSAVFIPGTGISLAHLRVVSIATSNIGSRSAATPTGAWIEYGAMRVNPRGAKAQAIMRIDDGYAATNAAFGALWDSAFAAGFTSALSASGRTITLAQGRAMSMFDLIEYFGFRASLFVLSRQAGLRGYLTVAQLQAIRDRGHLVAFQTFANPTDVNNSGIRLLGSYGFGICPAGTITAVAGNVLTWPGQPAVPSVNNVAAPQGFPVVFDFVGPPAGITLGATYWLRYLSSSTVSVHPSETDAADNINAVSFAGITAGNIVMRFFGATADESGVTADVVLGIAWMNANGFSSGAKIYAPNQGFVSEAVEAGMRLTGVTEMFCSNGFAYDLYSPAFAAGAFTYTTGTNFTNGLDYSLAKATIGTDGTGNTESDIRTYVRSHVQEGSLIQNVQHNVTTAIIQNTLWYLDELRYWADQGMVYVDTADKVAQAIRAVRIGG